MVQSPGLANLSDFEGSQQTHQMTRLLIKVRAKGAVTGEGLAYAENMSSAFHGFTSSTHRNRLGVDDASSSDS